MYNIAICDDEPIFASDLQKQVNSILFSREIEYTLTVFQSPRELMAVMREKPDAFQLVLLDIMLGEDNGIDIAKELRQQKSRVGIIFITSNPAFALDGYIVRPIQYLLKPVEREKLQEAILFDYDNNFTQKRLLISAGLHTYSFAYDEICYIEVFNHTLCIHKNTEAVECPGVLADFEQLLPTSFLRCHKSYLVNMDQVSDVHRYTFKLKNGDNVPISKVRFAEIQQTFVSYATR